jgi:hypothetical protein
VGASGLWNVDLAGAVGVELGWRGGLRGYRGFEVESVEREVR